LNHENHSIEQHVEEEKIRSPDQPDPLAYKMETKKKRPTIFTSTFGTPNSDLLLIKCGVVGR
jgi:hypothetical protein